LTPRLIIGVLAICAGGIAGISSSLLMLSMVDEVNRKRDQGDQISSTGFFYYPKTQRILTEYRRLYPEGQLHRRWWTAVAVGMLGLIVAGICIGFSG
jgi:hypothetical protein